MNIFVLDKNPKISAEKLMKMSAIRARKYVVEYVQAVATICHNRSLPVPIKKDGTLYGKRHFPKPLMSWVEYSSENCFWAFKMALRISELMEDNHASLSTQNISIILNLISVLPNRGLSEFVNYAKSMSKGLDYTQIKDTTLAYTLYLNRQTIPA